MLTLDGAQPASEAIPARCHDEAPLSSRVIQWHTSLVAGEFLHVVIGLRFGEADLGALSMGGVDRVAEPSPKSGSHVDRGQGTACTVHTATAIKANTMDDRDDTNVRRTMSDTYFIFLEIE